MIVELVAMIVELVAMIVDKQKIKNPPKRDGHPWPCKLLNLDRFKDVTIRQTSLCERLDKFGVISKEV